MNPSANISTPYTDTAVSPPIRTSIAFIKIEVILPAILFKKFGLPQATICRIILPVKAGRQNRSSALPRKKGTKAITAQISMPEHVASAAAQIPQRKTLRNRNSRIAIRTDIRIFKSMLPRIYPQILRQLSAANTIVVMGEQRA